MSTRDPLLPRSPDGMGRGLVLAVLAHLLLVAGLAVGVNWRASNPQGMQAELWAAVPTVAAPRAAAPEPPPPVPKKQPPPRPEPAKQAPPPPPPPPPPEPEPAPVPKKALPDPQIAIEKARKEERERRLEAEREQELVRKEEAKKLAAKKLELAKAEAVAKALEAEKVDKAEKAARAKAEAAEKAALAKAEAAEKAAALEKEKKRKEEELRQAKLEEAKEKAEAKRLADNREAAVKRMLSQAGGSTGEVGSKGTADQNAAPSNSYAGRVKARVKPNIVFVDQLIDNPQAEVLVRLAPDGRIISQKLVTSSGSKDWDQAVQRAIDRTEILPRDTDGRVPSSMLIAFRPRE